MALWCSFKQQLLLLTTEIGACGGPYETTVAIGACWTLDLVRSVDTLTPHIH